MKPRPATSTPDDIVRPAAAYQPVDDLAIVTCYYNPAGYASKLENFSRFRERIVAAGLPLIIVECTFGERPRQLPIEWGAVHVVARHVLWQKERLLNLAVAAVPPAFKKIAWLDADVLFTDPDWARNASRALDDVVVVQLYAQGALLPRERMYLHGSDRPFPGFAAAFAGDPRCLRSTRYIDHGHTGFAWAARRTFLADHGIYDRCLSGSADHVMAHAYCGDWESPCLTRTFGTGSAMLAHFQAWAEGAHAAVRARIGHVPGTILHVWHGDFNDRHYDRRNQELIRLRFDPDRDVRLAGNGCLEWTDRAGRLRQWAADYFRERREDGR
jgi:hypothetical protein